MRGARQRNRSRKWIPAAGRLAGLVVALLFVFHTALAARPDLPRQYKEWLEGPVSYLITPEERQAFLRLRTDQEREAFIERFWELRNPAPGSGRNEFKEEFYRRVAYANAFFGREAGTEGWRTDRGKTYILFGRPQSTMNFTAFQELYPIELWFYANPGLSELPPFFYVLFYEKDGISGYRLYHPYVDGPDKLVRNALTKQQAYNYLRNINPELARATLSLIPGEPIDTETFTGSMASSQIINAIQGYNQMPSYVALIRQRTLRLEQITTRIRYELPETTLVAFVAWQDGEPWVHWQLQLTDPKLGDKPLDRIEYEIRARLYRGGQFIYERTDQPVIPVPAGQWEQFRHRPLAYEDRMPVTPGHYSLWVSAVSRPTGETFEASTNFEVPAEDQRPYLSPVLLIRDYRPDPRPRPFQFSQVKFYPSPASQLQASQGLKILYQLLLPPGTDAPLEVEYAVGSTAGKARKTWTETLDPRAADSYGTLLVARSISLEEFAPGGCRIAIRVRSPQGGWTVATAGSFVIQSGSEARPPEPVVVAANRTHNEQWKAAAYYERALCWLASNQPSQAIAALKHSWQLSQSPAVQWLLERLEQQSRSRDAAPASVSQSQHKKGEVNP